ncbi:MAG: glycosyltransferase family 2 protein [Bacteroidia bacterium]|nr:glycosyltransferase family 2 protein [Bacteroidia bacterium]
MSSVTHSLPAPLVSIGIPTYNGGNRIDTALQSILSQEYRNVEVIISDNGSKDHTEEVCREWAAKDSRVKYFRHKENRGVSPNFEFALQQATGKYFMWMADDDEVVSDILQRYVDFLEQNAGYGLVSGQINYWENGKLRYRETNLSFEGENGLTRAVSYYWKVKEGALIYGLMRRDWGQKVRFLPVLGSDWHFVAGLAFQGKIKNLEFVGYNKHAGGVSRDFKNYARVFGEKPIWGVFPFVKMAIDAFKLVLYQENIYRKIFAPVRLIAAILSAFGILAHYYLWIKPRTIGGKILRGLNIKTLRERKLETIQGTE